MIGWFVWGAMYLARAIEYEVLDGWSLIVSFVRFLPLARLGAAESGVDCSVVGIITIASAFVSVTSELAVVVLNLGGACLASCVFAASQPTILTRAKAGHECREGCHRFWLFLAEVAGEPFITDAMFEGREGFGVRIIHNLVLFN